ncbi:MAG: Histone-lysine N-methyltransferase ezh1, partial [Paramarteilia canceri]
NISIQKGIGKSIKIGASTCCAGYGCFSLEHIEPNELIVEYKGEKISDAEAERRGILYDISGSSYIFGLNKDEALDAMYVGNKARFINHSEKPNCYAALRYVQGEQRVGIFAASQIHVGEELFFDYKYGAENKLDHFN